MTAVTTTYILVQDIGFRLDQQLGTGLGIAVGLVIAGVFLWVLPKLPPDEDTSVIAAAAGDAERTAGSPAS